MCLSPAAEGWWCARVLQRPAARVQQRRAARVLRLHRPLCHVLGVAHDNVPAKKRAHYGLVYRHREATTCRPNRIGSP